MVLTAKYASLLAGCIQQCFLILLIKYTKTAHNGPAYLSSVAVAASELFKICLSLVLEFATSWNPDDESTFTLRVQQLVAPMLICHKGGLGESIKLIVPAVLYLIQNNLTFVALSNLTVGTYQITNQGKLLATALLSRIIMKKELSMMQYASISLLGLGVAFIHLAEHRDTSAAETSDRNHLLGLAAALTCCITSSFSGVYFESVLKNSPTQLSLHCRNTHLASWSLCFAVLQILLLDFHRVSELGLFHGFDSLVILVVIAQGMSGFMFSMMIKYADNILKGFAVAISAVLSTVISVPLFGSGISVDFGIGTIMVLVAVRSYSFFSMELSFSGEKNVVKENEKLTAGLLSKSPQAV